MSDNRNLPARHQHREPATDRVARDADYAVESGGAVSWQRYAAAVYRFRWPVLALAVLGTLGGLYYSRNLPNEYTAEATIFFDQQPGGRDGPIQASEALRNEAWIGLARSWTVLDRVVRDQRLYIRHSGADAGLFEGFVADSAIAPGRYQLRVDASGTRVSLLTEGGELVEEVAAGAPVGAALGFLWQPPVEELSPRRVAEFTVRSPREAAKSLLNNLETRLLPGNSFMTLTYRGSNPAHVARITNAVAERYVEVAAELKRTRISEVQGILERQLEMAAGNLESAEQELLNFEVQAITLPTGVSSPGPETPQTPAQANYFQMTIERDQLQRDRAAIQRVLSTPPAAGLSVDAFTAIPSVRESPELSQALAELTNRRADLRALQQVYTDEHEEVRRALTGIVHMERTVIPRLASTLVAELNARAGNLDGMIQSAGGELRAIPTRAIQQAQLRRTVRSSEDLYTDLRRSYESARLGAETAVPDAQIFDRASIPSTPARDPRMRFAMFGFLGSVGLALALAVVLDRADPRVRYAEQITRDMRLTILGAIPNLAGSRLAGVAENAEVIEALRGVRLNLSFAYGSAGPIMVTITSPGPGDGKTFISSNLALAFRDLGMSTLLIDGDTRRGQQHRLFDVDRRAGLTDYLAGEASAEEIIRTTRFPGVDLIPAGTRRPDSPELLQSPRMSDLLGAIKQQYQVILVDSPPLGAGVDPLLLGALTGNMIMVVRNGNTDRQVAEAKLQMLDRLPVRLLGAVLNGVRHGEAYRYYSYLPGYESGRETEERAEERRALTRAE
jgi:polysaccharide biosynthesis transport protein